MAILATEKVPTLDFWKPAYKITVGDYLFDKNGNPTRVKLVQQYRSEDCYKITLDDQLTVSGDKTLALPTENFKYRNRLFSYKGRFKFRRPLRPMTAQTMEIGPLYKENKCLYSVPSTQPINLPHQDLPVPPFVFGFWFFNKNVKNQIKIPKEHWDVVEQKLKDNGYLLTYWRDKTNHARVYGTSPAIHTQIIPNNPREIPNNYLFSSVEQRIALLSGILYSKRKQYNPKKDNFRITGKSYIIMRQLQGLVESLGIKTKLSYREDFKEYTLFFKSRIKLVDHQESPPVKVHVARRFIKQITKIEPQLCVHIETEGADKSFLVGEGFIPCL